MMVEVWFYAGGYRKSGPPFGSAYRPHLVVKGDDEYLGVEFVNLPQVPFGAHIACEVTLLYGGVDYSGLTKGAAFAIKEGPHIVGEGFVC